METCSKCGKVGYVVACIDSETGEYAPLCLECHVEEFGE